MVAQYPGGNNTFVPNMDASGNLAVSFTRNVKDFALNSYVQIIPSKKTRGLYLNLTAEEAARLISSNGAQFAWADGVNAPAGFDGTESFEWLEYLCKRRAYPVFLGDMAADQADFPITDAHLAIKAQQAMSDRTLEVVTALTTTGNYASSNYSAVSSISGNTGKWDASTTARADIKRSLNYAISQIKKSTLGVVKTKDLVLVIGVGTARAIAESQELIDHVKQSPDALAQFRGELPGRNLEFGLPDRLYGVEVIVEDAVKVTSAKGATLANGYIFPASTAVLCSRVGALVGAGGAPNFSTVALFCYAGDDMAVETKHNVDDRRWEARIVDTRVAKVIAPASGFVFTATDN